MASVVRQLEDEFKNGVTYKKRDTYFMYAMLQISQTHVGHKTSRHVTNTGWFKQKNLLSPVVFFLDHPVSIFFSL